MELQINDLISSIKKDGIEAANQKADEIIAKAKKQAAVIVENAKKEAEKTVANAQSEIEVLKQSAKVSAEHAKRDAVLSFKSAVQAEFEKLLLADIGKTVNGKVLADLIKAAIAEEDPSNYTAEVAEINDELSGELAALIKGGLEIKTSKYLRVGFKLAAKDSSGYFDCSDEEIAEMLSPFFPEIKI